MTFPLWCVPGLLLVAELLDASPPKDIEGRINALLARMTMDEKIGQMSQSTSMGTLTEAIRQQIRQGRWGSFLNAGSPADRAEAQRIARQETRLGIPLLFGRDVIHGYRTVFPIPLARQPRGTRNWWKPRRAWPHGKLPPKASAGPSRP